MIFVINTICHHLPQASIQFDYGASSLRKWKPSWVFVTVMYLRNCLRKTYDSLIMVIYSRTIDILCCHLRGTPPCVYNHNMASCTSSTWQWPMGRNTCTWVTSWRHPDSHQQTSVHLLMHAPRYSVKGGNIQPKWRYSLVDQSSVTASPVNLGRSLLVWRRKERN